MIRFAHLFHALDATTKTNEKVAALVRYFEGAEPADAAWAIYYLSGHRVQRIVPSRLLRVWAAEQAQIPDWLLEESYDVVGDLAETIALLVPPGQKSVSESLADWIEQGLQPLRKMGEEQQHAAVLNIWRDSQPHERLVMMKLLTGAFRVGVSKRLVTRALAQHCDLPIDVIAHRLMGNWQPSAQAYLALTDPNESDALDSQPYPFCLAHPLEHAAVPTTLGEVTQYLAEWKWDGIRGQVIKRNDQVFIWSRGEELMENRWPEIERAAEQLPNGCVIDGEILASRPGGEVLPFAQLQRRIGRKNVGAKLMREVPVVFFAFDLLECEGKDIRQHPLAERRQRLKRLLEPVQDLHVCCTEILDATSWEQLAEIRKASRTRRAEGLMLKKLDAPYDVGRVRGTWWKWKIEPHTIDAVLIYAQKGHGKRASLYTDYTFALWKEDALVPFAKAYSGLSDAEIEQVDRIVRRNIKESFGPVRSVTPTLVMELAFEGLQRSTRHKSGVATRFPRILRWRQDKSPQDANSLADLMELLDDE